MKIFVISPASIIGEMIIKGIARGFEELGAKVICYDIKNIDRENILDFKPDFIFGMDYLHFMDKEAEILVKSLNCPTVHYFIDDPKSKFAHSGDQSFYEKLNQKKDKIVFCWDKKYINDFSPPAHYLSTGIDFDLYSKDYPELNIQSSKILFAGRPLTDRRERIIAEVVKNFPDELSIYCYKKHFEKSVQNMKEKKLLSNKELKTYRNCYKGFLKNEKELSAAYHRAEIILNITLEQGLSSMNSRVLESLATSSCLITDYVADTVNYFKEGEELLIYRNPEELIKLLDKYLYLPQKRSAIEGKAIEKIKQNHTLISRSKEILKVLNVNTNKN